MLEPGEAGGAAGGRGGRRGRLLRRRPLLTSHGRAREAGQREEDQVEAAGGGADRGRAPAHRGRGLVRRQVPLGAREAEHAEAAGGLKKNCEVSTLGL